MTDYDFMPIRFLKELKLKPSCVSDFWKCKDHNIPKLPGVYLLIAKNICFRYPAGRSSIYYIGQTESLHKRLVKQHRKYHNRVKDNRRLGDYLYEARHEYGGTFGGRYCFIQSRGGISPKKLEKKVIRAFMQRYHAPPVANGAGVWGWVKKVSLK
ncbi:MAG TPA: hypothetical protein VMH30_05310, partial [Verrucomicrobiae bacterium]|nr:hypothetical protein [Verrucomicrobiae bacterium]